jgi:hypothetical protein
MNSAELPAPQIGRILIAAGLLTEDQLSEALEEQAQTSRRLGEIIVQRGFISGPALANALAEQHGGVLKTEYGYATGLGGEVAKRAAAAEPAPAEPEPPLPRLRTVSVPMEEVAAEPEPEPAPEPEPVVEPVPEPAPEPETEQPLPPAAEQPAAPAAPAPTEPERDERDELIASLRLQLDVQQAELVALREALERERARSQPAPEPVQEQKPEPEVDPEPEPEVQAEPEPTAETTTAASPQDEQYLLCVPTNAGYVLVDRVGAVPEVGDEVEVPEEHGKFFVTKVVRLPRNARACAYLQRDRPAA